jgi:WD40 repeat protein
MRIVILILFITVLGCGDDSSPKSNSTSSPDSLPEPETATNSDNTAKSKSPTNHGLATGDNVIVIKDATLAQDDGTETVLAKGTKLTVSKVDGDQIWTHVLSPVVLEGHKGNATTAGFSPDGKFIVSGGGITGQFGEAVLWDSESGKKLRDLKRKPDLQYIAVIGFDPRGIRIAAASFPDRTVVVWDVTSKDVTNSFAVSHSPTDIAFSPDGSLLAVAETGYHPTRSKRFFGPCDVSLWNLRTGKRTFTLKGNRRDAHCVSFSTDGKSVASGGKDGSIRIWDVNSGRQLNTWPTGSAVADIVYMPDGKFIASIGDAGDVQLWQVKTGKIERTLGFSGRKGISLACSSDGALIASAYESGVVRLWDARDGKMKLEFRAHGDMIQGLQFSQDGNRLVSASHDSGVTVWTIGTGEGLSGWVPSDSLLKVID